MQLRDAYEDFRAAGADIVAIGMGLPEDAAEFKSSRNIPFRLLADTDQETYRALDIERASLAKFVTPSVLLKGTANLLKGEPSRPTRLDMKQLGGVAIVDTNGEIVFLHRSNSPADNAPVEKLLAALP